MCIRDSPDADTQVLISTIDYNEYVGRIGVGKVESGTIAVNQELTLLNHHDPDKKQKVKISKLYEFDGLNKVEVKEATIGSIVAISGIAEIHIGDTLCGGDNPEAIPFQKISEPTIAMNFLVNDSPLAGQEGKYITSRHLRDRLYRELNTDVSLRVEDTETTAVSYTHLCLWCHNSKHFQMPGHSKCFGCFSLPRVNSMDTGTDNFCNVCACI